MSKKTKKAYEEHLNETYNSVYSSDDAVDKFCYLKDGEINDNTIREHHTNRTLGTLLRKEDPIAFQVGFNEWV